MKYNKLDFELYLGGGLKDPSSIIGGL